MNGFPSESTILQFRCERDASLSISLMFVDLLIVENSSLFFEIS